MATPASRKPIQSIIIDTGPLINNTVSISTIINSAEVLYTTPAIIAEIRDPATRSRVETILLPFLNIKTPSPASFEAVTAFSKKTNDFAVLSKQDLGILALAYEVHCEKNGGSFGLRDAPNGPLKLRPEEQAKVDEQNAKKEAEHVKHDAAVAKREAKEASVQRRKQERKQKKHEETIAQQKATAQAKKGELTGSTLEGGIELSGEPSTTIAEQSMPTDVATEATQSQIDSKETSFEPITMIQEPSENIVTKEEDATADSQQQDDQTAAQAASPKPKDGRKKKVNSKKARRARAWADKQHFAATAEVTEQQTADKDLERSPEDVDEETGGVEISDAAAASQQPELSGDPTVVEQTEQASEPEAQQKLEHTQSQEVKQEIEQPSSTETKSDIEQPQQSEEAQNLDQLSSKKLHPAKARLARRAAEREALATDAAPSSFPTQQPTPPATSDEDSDSDGGEWITPGNLQKHQSKDTLADIPLKNSGPQLDVATMTTDYAMQNVLLQMNLHLLSPAMQRIRTARSTVLRCHACFLIVHEQGKQFCSRCGQPTLNRVKCSTDADGTFKLHLAKNFQYNKRGDKYSIPKPVGGTSNGKMRGTGGGKGGWGRELVLSEDQKEYQKSVVEQKRASGRDPMDQDFLPGLLTGDRAKAEGKVKVGAGRNINSRKRF